MLLTRHASCVDARTDCLLQPQDVQVRLCTVAQNAVWLLQDCDVLEDLDSRVLGYAWLWLPLDTRCMLLQTATDLAQLAVDVQPPNLESATVSDTTAVPTLDAPQHSNVLATQPCNSSAASSHIELTLHSMAKLLAASQQTVCSPLLTAMEIVNLGKTASRPDEALITESLQSGSSLSSSSTSIFSDVLTTSEGSAHESTAERSLYMLLTRAYLSTSNAVAVCDHSQQRVSDSTLQSSGDTAVGVIIPSDQSAAQAKLSSGSIGLLSSLGFTFYSILRLLWVAVMGDVAFWQEAAHIMSNRKQHGPFSLMQRGVLFAALSALGLVAAISQVKATFLRASVECFYHMLFATAQQQCQAWACRLSRCEGGKDTYMLCSNTYSCVP